MRTPDEALARTRLLVQRDVYPDASSPAIVDALVDTRVRLVADAANLASPAGRTALVATFVLIAELGCEVRLDIAPVEASDQPPLRPGQLDVALLELGSDLITPARLDDGHAVDVAIAIGDTPLTTTAARTLRVSGDDFSARLSDPGVRAPRWSGAFPFGAMLGASAATAETFKETMRKLGNRLGSAPATTHAHPDGRPIRLALPPIYPLGGEIQLGTVDAISAGAITHSTLFTLLRLPNASGSVRTLDEDRLARSNLNRYMLARASQLSLRKVEPLERLSTAQLRISGEGIRLDEATARLRSLSDRVIVGVDHVPSRWVAQRHAPGWVGVGATSHFEVLASSHPAGRPCAGCLHPRDEDDIDEIPTVSFVSALAGTLLAYRLTAHVVSADEVASSTLAAPLNLAGTHALLTQPVPRNLRCPVESDIGSTRVAA